MTALENAVLNWLDARNEAEAALTAHEDAQRQLRRRTAAVLALAPDSPSAVTIVQTHNGTVRITNGGVFVEGVFAPPE